MAKVIKYKFLSCEINRGTEESPVVEQIFLDKEMPWSKANEAIARLESKDGKYTVEDDGTPDPAEIPSRLDQIEAQAAYTAMMTGTLMDGGGANV